MKVITIGRGQDNDHVIDSPEVSRYNTQIIKADDGSFSIVDMGSANGTYVNGERISGERPLKSNDTVIVGNVAIDWKRLFKEQTTTGRVAAKSNWVLPVVLGAVSLGLVIAIVYMMLLFVKYKKEDARKLDALEKAHVEYMDDVQLDSNLTAIKMKAYQDALATAKNQTEAEKNKKSAMEQEARKNEALAKKNEEEATARIKEAEKTNRHLQQEIDEIKSSMAREIAAKDGSLKNVEKQKENLLTELEAEQKKVKEMNRTTQLLLREYRKSLDTTKVQVDVQYREKFYKALAGVPLEDVCRILQYEFSDSIPPRNVLMKKMERGEGDLIMAVANVLKERN